MSESVEERHARLVQHAKSMRETRAAKRMAAHKCPMSPLDAAYANLLLSLNRVAPGNIASMPIAMGMENGKWTVDISVRVPGITDYEVSTHGTTLDIAITNAAQYLNDNHVELEGNGRKAATRYGYTL